MRLQLAAARAARARAVLGAWLALATVMAAPAAAQSPTPRGLIPGGRVEELLVLARQLSPELAARALEIEAATAKAAGAGSLDDPILRLTADEVDRTEGGRINKWIYGIEQEIPLWGKRELRREIARAELQGARGRERAAVAELDYRVKVAFAQYYIASRSIEITHDVHALLHAIAGAAQARYAQGTGTQADAIRAEVERTRLDLSYAALERDRRTAAARLNALLARPPGSPLAEPEALRPIPAAEVLSLDDLMARAREQNPDVATARAESAAGESGRRLAERGWYPDVTVSFSGIDRANGPPGFMAGVAVKVPLQWGLKESQIGEARARSAAARSRVAAATLRIQAMIDEALAGLAAARQVEVVLMSALRPQTEAGYRSVLGTYQLGRGELAAVLEAAHRVQEVRLELLKVQGEQQKLLAEIEQAIGSDL